MTNEQGLSQQEFVVRDLSQEIGRRASEISHLRMQVAFAHQELTISQQLIQELKDQVRELGGEVDDDAAEGEESPT